MNSSELSEAFRSGLGSERSRMFSDHDVWRMANDAYRTFVRLIGGIPDFTSEACQATIKAGEAISLLSPLILRIVRIQRQSDDGEIDVINYTDVSKLNSSDYGRSMAIKMDNTQGVVRYGVVGMEKNKIRWIAVPAVDDIVNMQIYRLPKTVISKPGQDLSEVEEQHHYSLLMHMNSLACATPMIGDASKAGDYEAAFETYCAKVRAEMERYKAKGARTVRYGGY